MSGAAMVMQGNLQNFSLSELFQLLEQGEKNGLLSVETPNGIFRVWFHQGRIIAALAPDQWQKLHYQLVSSGIVNQEVAERIAAISRALEQPLGICLQRQGLVSDAMLAQMFRHQLQSGLYPLLGLAVGQFSFTLNPLLPFGEMTGLSCSTQAAIQVGLAQLEQQQQPVEVLPQPDSYLQQVSFGLPMQKLSSLEWLIWEHSVFECQIREIAQASAVDLLEVRMACARLIHAGLLKEISVSAHASMTKLIIESAQLSAKPVADSLSVSLRNRLIRIWQQISTRQRD